MSIIERSVSRMMSVPDLYHLVQTTIAGPLHEETKALLKLAIPDRADIKVLDIGCGVGDYAAVFEHVVYEGVDLDSTYIDMAKRTYSRPSASFFVGDATNLVYRDGSFDYCMSIGFYHHISDEDTVKSLRDSLRISGKGRVIVVDAIFPPKGNWVGYILRKLDRGKHVRTATAYEKLLRDNFDVAEIGIYRAGLLDYLYYRI